MFLSLFSKSNTLTKKSKVKKQRILKCFLTLRTDPAFSKPSLRRRIFGLTFFRVFFSFSILLFVIFPKIRKKHSFLSTDDDIGFWRIPKSVKPKKLPRFLDFFLQFFSLVQCIQILLFSTTLSLRIPKKLLTNN